jgi:hypothetical protein
MLDKFSSVIVVLAMCVGSLVADDKDKKGAKKEANKQEAIKGSVSKFDKDKHSLTLKTDVGERDYTLAEELLIAFGSGQKVTASRKLVALAEGRSANAQGHQVLAFVLKTGNKVEVVLAEMGNTVKEIHWDNRALALALAARPGNAAVTPALDHDISISVDSIVITTQAGRNVRAVK